jgi:phosphate transport system substrate-binding protein
VNRSKQSVVFLTPGVVILLVFTFSLFALTSELYAAGPEKKIRIGGTGTARAAMKLLGQQFRKKHPDITIIVLPSLGSSGGIKALSGKLDVTLSSGPSLMNK